MIEITPEEKVRQAVAKYAEFIRLEMPVTKYVNGTYGRADIVIHDAVDNEMMRPMVITECKNKDVALTDKVTANVIGSPLQRNCLFIT